MKFDEMAMGTRLELELLSNVDEKTGYKYVSQLLEPVKGRASTMVISTPISEARLIFLPLNSKIRVTFFHKRYGLMGFTAAVQSRENRGNISILRVEAESGLERVQRRQHYRLDCLLNAEYRILSNTSDTSGTEPLYKTTVKNISGSGACIIIDANIPEKNVLELFISLSPGVDIKTMGIILRNQPVEVKSIKRYELGLYFSYISKRDQDQLIKYIFEQQRMLINKDVLK